MDDFQKGIDVMSKIIEKPVTLTVTANRQSIFSQLKNLDIIIIYYNIIFCNCNFLL